MSTVLHLAGETFHGRKGDVSNAFRYRVDYVLLNPDETPDGPKGPSLFSRNRGNLTSLHDTDHGGPPGLGTGTAWVRQVLSQHGLPQGQITLLAQPRLLGHVFNPVSFWLVHDDQANLRTVIAEVTNTFGDRHSYLCHHESHAPILPTDHLKARKILHVSPFQPVEGGYTFRFDIRPDRIGIWIDYTAGTGGLVATLTGPLAPLTNRAILKAALRRPFGSRRVLALIHWQALKLWAKGAPFRSRPTPPATPISPPERP